MKDSEDHPKKEIVILRLWPVSLLFLGVYIPVSFFVLHDTITGFIQSAAFIIILITSLIFVKTKNTSIVGNVLAAVGIPVITPWLLTGGPSDAGLWWSSLYVLWVFFITTTRSAIFWLSIYLVINITIVVLSTFGYFKIAYPLSELVHVLFAFIITFVLIYVFNQINEYYYRLSNKELLERKKAEVVLKEKSHQLSQLNTSLLKEIEERKKIEQDLVKAKIAEKVAEALAFKNRQLSDFCSIISHNLRGPLGNISMLSDFIESTTDVHEQKLLLGKIKPVVNHLNEVFDELVESLQVGQDLEIKSDTVILKDCLDNILIGFETQIKSYNVEIQLDIEDTPEIDFPHKYLQSILTNLISNALKYKSPERNPKIKIKTKKTGESILLSVSDNGLGIDLKLHQNNLFKIRKTFHKHPEAKGFGLFMTKTQVDAMGGKIWVESKVDTGSTFFVEFINQKP